MLLVFCSNPAILSAAVPGSKNSEKGANEQTWHISADQIEYDKAVDQFVAEGDVVVSSQEQKLYADYVRYDKKNNKAYALGNVLLVAGKDVLRGERMTLDLQTRTGTAYKGNIFIQEGQYRLWGDKIQKTGERTYLAENAVVTTCQGDSPDWKVSGTEAEVTLEGYGTVHHATLWAKDMPVLYSPFLFFPAKRKRQSGFLTPRFSFSDRMGAQYEQPYFWAINDQTDATFYWDHMQERGEKLSTEYRYVLDRTSKGAVLFDFLKDAKIDDGLGDNPTQWGYEDDSVIRPNSKRYWFRSKVTQKLPFGFTGKLDLDVVSDQDYLTDFRDGYSGFDETVAYFEKNYSRGLDDYTDTTRTNTLILGKSWDQYSLTIEGRWTDDLLARQGKILTTDSGTGETSQTNYSVDSNGNRTDTTLQLLPSIQFNGSRQEAWDNAWLFWNFSSESVYLYRIDGMRGERVDMYPRLYVPIRYRNYFSLEPSLGLRETVWYITDDDDGTSQPDNPYHREFYDIQVDLSSEVYQVYSPGWNPLEQFRHSIRPRITYTYQPDINQSDLPYFDSVDRISNVNQVTYSLLNTFRSKNRIHRIGTEAGPDAKQAGPAGNQPPSYVYQDFCRLELSQSYDFNKKMDNDPEPFSNIIADLQFNLWRYFSIDSDASWNPYSNELEDRNIGLHLFDLRGDRFFIEYRRSGTATESLHIDSCILLTERFSLYFDLDRDLIEKKYIETRASLLYKTGCWSADFGVKKTQEDIKYSIMINLFGLGGLGRSVRPGQ